MDFVVDSAGPYISIWMNDVLRDVVLFCDPTLDLRGVARVLPLKQKHRVGGVIEPWYWLSTEMIGSRSQIPEGSAPSNYYRILSRNQWLSSRE